MAEYPIFYSGLLGALKTYHHIAETENDPMNDTALIALSEFAFKRGIDLSGDWIKEHYNGAQVGALQDFMEFAEHWQGVPKQYNLKSVTLSIAVPSGKGTVTFSATAECETNFMGLAYIGLYDELIKAYEMIRNKRNIAASNGSSDNGNSASGEETIALKYFTAEDKNGKKYIRAHGGRWEKFGVACYPEALKDAGINAEQIRFGRNTEIPGLKMVISLRDNGKPNKVERILDDN